MGSLLCVVCGSPNKRANAQICSLYCKQERARRKAKQWQINNHERAIARIKAWQASNPEKCKEYTKRSNSSPGKVRRSREYGQRHKERLRKKLQDYRKKNPNIVVLQNKRNRARRRGAEGRFSSAEWNLLVWLFRGCCAYCGEPKKLEADHVIPVSKGGSNYIENILPACRSCNARKNDKLDFIKL